MSMDKLEVVVFDKVSTYDILGAPKRDYPEYGDITTLRGILTKIPPKDFINLMVYPNFDSTVNVVLVYKVSTKK